MKPQFTPGPYEISHEVEMDGMVEIMQESDAQQFEPVALVYTAEAFDPSVYTKNEYAELAAECRANARLFKHAPEMFYALEFFAGITVGDARKLGINQEVNQLRKLLTRIMTDEQSE